jgi:hypothetical protein
MKITPQAQVSGSVADVGQPAPEVKSRGTTGGPTPMAFASVPMTRTAVADTGSHLAAGSVSPRRGPPPNATPKLSSQRRNATMQVVGPVGAPLATPDQQPSALAPAPGALVLVNPAAVSFDIPASRNSAGEIVGAARVGTVYGNVTGTDSNGISEGLAKLLGKTLQQVNPASYGKRSITDVINRNVRGDADSSLTIVVRDKNIQGSSPASDSVATQVTQASAAEYELGKIAAMDNPNAFAAAVGRIRLGSAKIYAQPPALDAVHVDALKNTRAGGAGAADLAEPRGGADYGYVGQVVGANLKGSGLSAMQTLQRLAQAANMKGLTLYTNEQAGWYASKLQFETVAVTGQEQGVQSSHMVWENGSYNPTQPTLTLDNPAVVNSLKSTAATQ